AVTPGFILAITADGDRRSFCDLRQELDYLARIRALHLLPVLSEEGRDWRPGFQEPCEQRPAGSQRRKPDIKVVFPGVVFLADATREEPDGPDTEPFAALTRRPSSSGLNVQAHVGAILRFRSERCKSVSNFQVGPDERDPIREQGGLEPSLVVFDRPHGVARGWVIGEPRNEMPVA